MILSFLEFLRLASNIFIAPKVSLERPASAANMDTYARKTGAGGGAGWGGATTRLPAIYMRMTEKGREKSCRPIYVYTRSIRRYQTNAHELNRRHRCDVEAKQACLLVRI